MAKTVKIENMEALLEVKRNCEKNRGGKVSFNEAADYAVVNTAMMVTGGYDKYYDSVIAGRLVVVFGLAALDLLGKELEFQQTETGGIRILMDGKEIYDTGGNLDFDLVQKEINLYSKDIEFAFTKKGDDDTIH